MWPSPVYSQLLLVILKARPSAGFDEGATSIGRIPRDVAQPLAHRAVLVEVTPSLAHHPHRRTIHRLAAAGLQKTRGFAHSSPACDGPDNEAGSRDALDV